MRVSFGLALALAVFACGKKPAAIIDGGVIDAPIVDAEVPDAPVDAPGIDAPVGHPGTGTVTGAVQASSPNYRLFGTLRSGDGSSESPNHQRRGGITGATQR